VCGHHLFSPGPVECNSKVLMEQALVVGGLKQLICAKKKFFRVHPVLSTVQHFQHTNCFKLVQQLDPLLAADSGYNHVSALGKPKVYKIHEPFLKVDDVSQKFRPLIYTPRR